MNVWAHHICFSFPKGLKLQLVGRNFYDPDAKVPVEEFKLELWPGYITSIRQHEEDLCVCVEFVHKLMRMETVHDIMVRLRREHHDFKSTLEEDILGTTVLTDYNNKTYYIDDIDYAKKPSDLFVTKEGSMTYIQYYKQVSLEIQDRSRRSLRANALLGLYQITISNSDLIVLALRHRHQGPQSTAAGI